MADSLKQQNGVSIRFSGAALGMFLCLSLNSFGRNLEEALPADSLGYFKINGLRRIVEETKEHPVVELWKDRDVQRFFRPLLEEAEEGEILNEFTEELDVTSEELLEYFPGQLVVALPSELPEEDGEGEEPPVEMLYLTEYGGSLGTLRDMIESSARFDSEAEGNQHRILEEKYLEARLFLEEVTEGDQVRFARGYALLDGIVVLASRIELLKETVARLSVGSSEDSLTESGSYRRFKDRVGDSDLEAYFNLEGLMKEIREQVLKEERNAQPSFFGVSAQKVLDILALDVLEGIFLSINLDADETTIDAGLLYSEKRGLIRLLAYREGKLTRPEFVPEDALTAGVSLFSLREFWVSLEELVFKASPMLAGLYHGALEQMNANLGVDLRSNLIDNIGDEIVAYSGIGKGRVAEKDSGLENLSSVVAVAIRDRKGFEIALEALKSTFGGGAELFDEREYLDNIIYTQKARWGGGDGDSDAPEFAYALTDRYLLIGIGSTTLLEEALVRLRDPGKSIWQNRDLAEAMRRLGDGGVDVRYQDFGALLNSLFVTLVNLQERIPNRGENNEICDPTAIPRNLEFPYFLLSLIYSEDTGLFGKSLLLKKSE